MYLVTRLQACCRYEGVVGRLFINHKQLGHNLQFTQRRKGAKTAKINEFLLELFYMKKKMKFLFFLRFWNVVYNWGDAGYALSRGAVSALLNRFNTQVSALLNLFSTNVSAFLNPFSAQISALLHLFSTHVSTFLHSFST